MCIEEKIIEFVAIANHMQPEDVSLSSDLHKDLMCKSMSIVALTAQIEDEYDVTISFDEANRLDTVQDFVDKVKAEQ